MSGQKPSLVIRADAGPRVGTGHVMRCLALGQSWAKLGGDVNFVTGTIPGGLERKILQQGFRLYQIDGRADSTDARNTREICHASNAQWLVIDGYRFGDTYQASLKTQGTKTIVCDDYGHGNHTAADVVLNPNIYATTETYNAIVRPENALIGPRFLLLRDEFRETQPSSNPKTIVAQPRRILITMGGADPENATQKTLEALQQINRKGMTVDVVLGAAFSHMDSLQSLKRSSHMSIRFHRNVDRMSTLFRQVDLAVTAGGGTSYELARCGVPAVYVTIADNQVAVARRLGDLGIGLYAGHADTLNQTDLSNSIRKLMGSASQRSKMSLRGRALVDGQGAERTSRFMFSHLYNLESAQPNDAETLYRWRLENETVNASFGPPPTRFADHCAWVQRQIADPSAQLLIARDLQDREVGQIRLETATTDHRMAVIGISLDASRRGQGLGTTLIEKATRLATLELGFERVLAQIKPENTASQMAFKRADYRPIASTTIGDDVAFQMMFDKNAIDHPTRVQFEQPQNTPAQPSKTQSLRRA